MELNQQVISVVKYNVKQFATYYFISPLRLARIINRKRRSVRVPKYLWLNLIIYMLDDRYLKDAISLLIIFR